MIAFGSAVTAPDVYERCARRGFERAAEPGAAILALPAEGSIFHSYNRILDRAAELEELEALVLTHQDVEIVDPGLCATIRAVLADPEVGVIGSVGAVGVRTIAWWEGSVAWASIIHRYRELGGGDFPSLTWDPADLPPYARRGEVDTVDGLIMVLSAWTVRNVRFDEALDLPLHGYDFDLCTQVRAAGRKVCSDDLRVVHHHSLELVDAPQPYVEAHMRIAEKWDGKLDRLSWAPGDWTERARRAEAEASVTRSQVRAWKLQIETAATRHREALAEIHGSTSLRLTAPLRRLRARYVPAGSGRAGLTSLANLRAGPAPEAVAEEPLDLPAGRIPK